MSQKELQQKIESYWENKDSLNLTDVDLRSNVDEVLNLLDAGTVRVSEKKNGILEANQWIKKAILLSFKTKDNSNVFIYSPVIKELSSKLIATHKELCNLNKVYWTKSMDEIYNMYSKCLNKMNDYIRSIDYSDEEGGDS